MSDQPDSLESVSERSSPTAPGLGKPGAWGTFMTSERAVMKWLRTALLAAIGGGVTSALAASFDPARFNWKHDIGSGKLWEFFIEGFLMMFAGLLVRSPFGQKVIGAYRDAEKSLDKAKADIDQAKKELTTRPPPD